MSEFPVHRYVCGACGGAIDGLSYEGLTVTYTEHHREGCPNAPVGRELLRRMERVLGPRTESALERTFRADLASRGVPSVSLGRQDDDALRDLYGDLTTKGHPLPSEESGAPVDEKCSCGRPSKVLDRLVRRPGLHAPMTATMELCPSCRTPTAVVVGRRAWCLRPYVQGGCGGHWWWTGKVWVLRWSNDR